jgi:hypothetical protein
MASDAIRDPYGEHVAATDGPLVGGYAITPGPLDLPAVYPFRVTRVLSEGTTATGILGLF